MFTLQTHVCSQHFVKNSQNLVAYDKSYNHSTKLVDHACSKCFVKIEFITGNLDHAVRYMKISWF